MGRRGRWESPSPSSPSRRGRAKTALPWRFAPGRRAQQAELGLAVLFGAEVLWLVFGVLLPRRARPEIERPSGAEDLRVLAQLLVAVGVGLGAASWAAGAAGWAISRRWVRGDPLGRAKTRAKFQAAAWQLVVHVGFTACELRVLSAAGDGESWWSSPQEVWSPLSAEYQGWQAVMPGPHRQPNKPELRWLYLAQLAVWVITAGCQLWAFEKQSDHLVMLAHHVLTIGLVGLSYQYNYVRFGVAVLLIHDASDILVDLMKLANYLKLEGRRALWATELLFAANLLSWCFFRLYLLPVQVILRGTFPFLEWFRPWAELTDSCPGGELGPPPELCLEEVAQHTSHERLWLSIVTGNGLLGLLVLLHLYWTALLLRILYGIATVGAHTTAAAEYEGDSGDEAGTGGGAGGKAGSSAGGGERESGSAAKSKGRRASARAGVGENVILPP